MGTAFFEENPLTSDLNRSKRDALQQAFPELAASADSSYLALWPYLNSIPQRFRCMKASDDVFSMLASLVEGNPSLLRTILADHGTSITLGMRNMQEVNENPVHDDEPPEHEFDRALFFDHRLLPAFVKLTEGAYSNLIFPLALERRISRGGSAEDMSVFRRVQELETTPYAYLTGPYSNTIRNAIAHGSVAYRAQDMVFADRRKTVTCTYREFVSRFDKMVDSSNGLALGISRFMLSSRSILSGHGITVPIPLLMQELRAQVLAPGWSVTGCMEFESVPGKKQLGIYARNGNIDPQKVTYHVLRTGVLAENLAPGYETYSIRFESRRSWKGTLGFAILAGPELKRLREQDRPVDEYGTALQTMFYVPALRLPRFVFRIGLFGSVILSRSRSAWHDVECEQRGLACNVRKASIHRSGVFSIVSGSVVVGARGSQDIRDSVRRNCRYLVRRTVRVARTRLSRFSITRHMPIGFARINVYTKDLRVRDLGTSGLIPELLATIELKRLSRVKTIDIMGGQPELVSGCRIVWNAAPQEQVDTASASGVV